MRNLLAFLFLMLVTLPAFAACQIFFTLPDGRLISSQTGPDYRVGDTVHFDNYNRSKGGLDVRITAAPLHGWDGRVCATIFPVEEVPRAQLPRALSRWLDVQ